MQSSLPILPQRPKTRKLIDRNTCENINAMGTSFKIYLAEQSSRPRKKKILGKKNV